jgi:hypothetical protein
MRQELIRFRGPGRSSGSHHVWVVEDTMQMQGTGRRVFAETTETPRSPR